MHCTRRRFSVTFAPLAMAVAVASCSSPSAPSPAPPPTPAPQVTCPADIGVTSSTDGPTAVTFQTPVPLNGTPPVTTRCAPPSGTLFPVGSTSVTCTATDAAARVATCGFNVRVALAPRLQKTSFLAFGDSMTEGFIALQAPTFALTPSPTSYPGQLQVLLRNRYASQAIAMDNEGLGGERAINGLERLQGLLRTSRPGSRPAARGRQRPERQR